MVKSVIGDTKSHQNDVAHNDTKSVSKTYLNGTILWSLSFLTLTVCVSLDGPRGKTRLPVTDLTLGQMVQSMGPVEEGVLRCFLKGVRQHGYLKGGAQERWWQRTGWGQEQWWGGGGKVGGRWSQQPQPQQGQQGWNQWQREGNGWVLQHRARG